MPISCSARWSRRKRRLQKAEYLPYASFTLHKSSDQFACPADIMWVHPGRKGHHFGSDLTLLYFPFYNLVLGNLLLHCCCPQWKKKPFLRSAACNSTSSGSFAELRGFNTALVVRVAMTSMETVTAETMLSLLGLASFHRPICYALSRDVGNLSAAVSTPKWTTISYCSNLSGVDRVGLDEAY